MTGNARLRHDTAWATARALLEIIVPALRPEEHQDAFDEFYKICLSALVSYDVQAQREETRIKPSRN